jgi:Protein of unknown function (DUF3631)
MTLPPPKVCQRIQRLHALIGSPVAGEAEAARVQLNKLLAKLSLTWNDLPAVLAAVAHTNDTTDTTSSNAQAATAAPEVNVLDLVVRLIELHIATTAEDRLAAALWMLHCYVFDRFSITPRLALLSPVRGCGKTTMLALAGALVAEPYRTDNVTAAAIYHQLDHRPRTTLLVDEGDNLDLLRNSVLRAVFNSGHRRGGGIDRFVGGWPRKFWTFAPLAVAAIGMLPLPLLHRAITIDMQRPPGENQLKQLDENDPAFAASREQIRKWAATCSLAHDPEMPPGLRDRAADNWRVLLAIADDLGHGEEARSAAITLCANRPDEDPGVTLLRDILTIFEKLGFDRISSALIVSELLGIEDGNWCEWRGVRDDRPPHKLTQTELASLLRPFQIRPKTVWPARRQSGDKSRRGYFRIQFEDAWRRYGPSADTPTQPRKIIPLHNRHEGAA